MQAKRDEAIDMQFHLFLPQMRLSLDRLVASAWAAEAAGFDGMAGMDHLTPPFAKTHPMYEAMVTNTWIAAHTERLTISSLVLCDAFRHPAVLAHRGSFARPCFRRPLRIRHRLGIVGRRLLHLRD